VSTNAYAEENLAGNKASATLKTTMIIVLIFGVAIALAFGILLGRSISNPIRKVTDLANLSRKAI